MLFVAVVATTIFPAHFLGEREPGNATHVPSRQHGWRGTLLFFMSCEFQAYKTCRIAGTETLVVPVMIILCYHDLSDSEGNPWTLSPAAFRDHLAILKERSFHSASIDDVNQDRVDRKRSVVITFDDGREGCHRYALEILESIEFTATFYICPSFVENNNIPTMEAYSRFMNWSQVRNLAKHGHTIGSHGLSHRSFKELSELQRLVELQISKDVIEAKVGSKCAHFAAPYGFIDSDSRRLIRDVGYKTAVTTERGFNKPPFSYHNLKRWQICSPCSVEEFERTLRVVEQEAV